MFGKKGELMTWSLTNPGRKHFLHQTVLSEVFKLKGNADWPILHPDPTSPSNLTVHFIRDSLEYTHRLSSDPFMIRRSSVGMRATDSGCPECWNSLWSISAARVTRTAFLLLRTVTGLSRKLKRHLSDGSQMHAQTMSASCCDFSPSPVLAVVSQAA